MTLFELTCPVCSLDGAAVRLDELCDHEEALATFFGPGDYPTATPWQFRAIATTGVDWEVLEAFMALTGKAFSFDTAEEALSRFVDYADSPEELARNYHARTGEYTGQYKDWALLGEYEVADLAEHDGYWFYR